MKIRIHCTDSSLAPYYATNEAAGADLRVGGWSSLATTPGEPSGWLIDTRVHIELPSGYEAQVRPRSSLNKVGHLVQFGTVDSDYRGEIKVVMWSLLPKSFPYQYGERIAQLVIAPVVRAEFEQVSLEELSETERGSGGFGSTNIPYELREYYQQTLGEEQWKNLSRHGYSSLTNNNEGAASSKERRNGEEA